MYKLYVHILTISQLKYWQSMNHEIYMKFNTLMQINYYSSQFLVNTFTNTVSIVLQSTFIPEVLKITLTCF